MSMSVSGEVDEYSPSLGGIDVVVVVTVRMAAPALTQVFPTGRLPFVLFRISYSMSIFPSAPYSRRLHN